MALLEQLLDQVARRRQRLALVLPGSLGQLFVGVVLTIGLLVLQVVSSPYRSPYDNLLAQLRGTKRVLLLSPDQFGRCYPHPTHHPMDRQSRVHLPVRACRSRPRALSTRGCRGAAHVPCSCFRARSAPT